MKNFLILTLAVSGIWCAPGTWGAMAASVVGTSSVGTVTTVSGLPHLAVGDVLTNTGTFFGGSQSGDFAGVVPPGTAITSESPLTAADGSLYTWTSVAGSFSGTVTGDPILQVNNETSRTLLVYILGTFTPDGLLAGFTPGLMSEVISYTETDIPGLGASFSFSATIASPPAERPDLPEPVTLSLLATGLIGLGLTRRRRR